jgi:hypothetical protein
MWYLTPLHYESKNSVIPNIQYLYLPLCMCISYGSFYSMLGLGVEVISWTSEEGYATSRYFVV